jgi:hypothetical protein
MEDNIVYNAIQTPDGTILQSKHRHDYVSYTDKNGQYYAVDGGLEYVKRSWDKPDYTELNKTFKECTLDECTKYLNWGQNYDADMNKLPETIFKPICELNTGHIEAILEGGYCKNEMYLKVFEYELNKRKKSCPSS